MDKENLKKKMLGLIEEVSLDCKFKVLEYLGDKYFDTKNRKIIKTFPDLLILNFELDEAGYDATKEEENDIERFVNAHLFAIFGENQENVFDLYVKVDNDLEVIRSEMYELERQERIVEHSEKAVEFIALNEVLLFVRELQKICIYLSI